MKNDIDKIDNISEGIIRNTSSELNNVLNTLTLEFEHIYCLIEDLSNDDKDKVISIVINRLLDMLKPKITIKSYHKITNEVDVMMTYFTSQKDSFGMIKENGNKIANELLFKEQYKLPIDISSIKKYCLSLETKKEQVYDVLIWIIIRLIAIDRRMTWQVYFDDLKENYKEEKVICNKPLNLFEN